MKTQTTYSDKSLLTILLCFVNLIFNKLFCNSSLPQQVCSANCSAILLFLNRSALHHVLFPHSLHHVLLSSVLLLLPVICSVSDMHFISFCTSIKLHPQHLLLSPFLLFHSFSLQNNQPNSVSFIFFYTSYLDDSTSPSIR
jgi:hypothetical protein